MAQFTGPAQLHGHPSREEWEQLLHNRLPQARVEARAAFLVTKQFILDYWAQWQQPAVRLAAG
jgi:hypothetical protein